MIQKKIDDPPAAEKAETPPASDDTAKKAPAESPAAKPAPTEIASTSSPAPNKPRRIRPPISLFNGKDLTGFNTYLGAPHGESTPYGMNKDPLKVFSVEDGTVHVSGQVHGALETIEEYSSYRLTLEYRWGEKEWPREEGEYVRPHLSGVAFHCGGEPGSLRHAFRPGFRCRITGEHPGDLVLFPGPDYAVSVTVRSTKRDGKEGPRYHYDKDAEERVITRNWTIHAAGPIRPSSHPTSAALEPDNAWHTLEIHAPHDSLKIEVDGKTVMAASKPSPSRGKIQLLSLGSEIYFRNIKLHHLAPSAR
jgi:hypothetical protein